MKPKRLGRGLRGLINPSETEALPPSRVQAPAALEAGPVAQDPGVRELAVADVRPNPYQPRTAFRDDDLDDLKASILEHGLLQPIVVRRAALGYEVIAGERRLRAIKALGRETVPALLREADDEDMQTLALVENLQRVDLNAVEKARALQAMMRNFELTQQQVADRVGKARTSISNLVRLLELPQEILDLVSEGALSGAHARAVLLVHGTPARLALARRAAREGLSVRRIEQLAAHERRPASPKAPASRDPYVEDLEGRLRQALGTAVTLRARTGGAGSIEIAFHDANELDRLLELFGAA